MTVDLQSKKQAIVKRLLEEGNITFEEALMLLETVKEKEYVYVPQITNSPPSFPPYNPLDPFGPTVYYTNGVINETTHSDTASKLENVLFNMNKETKE